MRLSKEMRKAINQEIRESVSGCSLYGEIGRRYDVAGELTENARAWEEDGDLQDLIPLRDLREIEDDEFETVWLDVYVYGFETPGDRDSWTLFTNLYVEIDKASGAVRASLRPWEEWRTR